MASDDRNDRDRERARGRALEWRGDDSFGGGWGNQTSRPQRLGDRGGRPGDDPEHGQERYGGGLAGDAFGQDYGGPGEPSTFDMAPGYDPSFGGSRFDRVDVGSVGSHGVHPVSSVFGGDYNAFGPSGGFRSSARRFAELQRHGHHDPHYSEWRSRQIAQLDRDYDEYRREHQSRFDKEFGEWRERRGRQRQAVSRVTEHMEVVGSDGSHVGTVDCARGESIILTRSDPSAGGHHHIIPCGWVDNVDDKVRLNLTAGEAMKSWRDEEQSSALFDRDDERGRTSPRRDEPEPRRRADRPPEMRGTPRRDRDED
jgi:hypothetical protein